MANTGEKPLNQQELSDIITLLATSIVDANHAASLRVLDLIKQLGFTGEEKNNWKDLRLVYFNLKKQNSAGEAAVTQVGIPILSLVTLPQIQIKECDINFSVELVGLEQKAKIKDGISSIEQLKSLNVRLSNESKDGDGNSATNSITVNLHFYEPDLPAGWITMLNLLKNSMTLKDTN